jgi:hypothetical protein
LNEFLLHGLCHRRNLLISLHSLPLTRAAFVRITDTKGERSDGNALQTTVFPGFYGKRYRTAKV